MNQHASSPAEPPAPANWPDVFAGIGLVLRLELGGLFLLAAYHKLWAPNGPQLFSASVQAFKLHLPDALTRLATFGTPWVETVASIGLVLGIWTRAAATVLALLLGVFIILIVSVLLRHLDVECGCFGKFSPFCHGNIGLCHIVQDCVMLAAAVAIALTPRHKLVLTR